ncbi:hypothetical protein TNIN_434471 [Trichonephila inaurata madagascariensis]|uniref:Uncharacterized protein n=1 Tax=Trichonephila inaurata madagascariensis TaxID=2747483 RepID=A0A8X6JVL7_9ARAC|nr:hypothetical protein TNIN_434471 [Trichonephila inaurata madagascariensis]
MLCMQILMTGGHGSFENIDKGLKVISECRLHWLQQNYNYSDDIQEFLGKSIITAHNFVEPSIVIEETYRRKNSLSLPKEAVPANRRILEWLCYHAEQNGSSVMSQQIDICPPP